MWSFTAAQQIVAELLQYAACLGGQGGEEETWKWVKAFRRRPQHPARIYSAVLASCRSITRYHYTHRYTYPADPCWGKVIPGQYARRQIHTATHRGGSDLKTPRFSYFTEKFLSKQSWEWQSIKDMGEYISDSQMEMLNICLQDKNLIPEGKKKSSEAQLQPKIRRKKYASKHECLFWDCG